MKSALNCSLSSRPSELCGDTRAERASRANRVSPSATKLARSLGRPTNGRCSPQSTAEPNAGQSVECARLRIAWAAAKPSRSLMVRAQHERRLQQVSLGRAAPRALGNSVARRGSSSSQLDPTRANSSQLDLGPLGCSARWAARPLGSLGPLELLQLTPTRSTEPTAHDPMRSNANQRKPARSNALASRSARAADCCARRTQQSARLRSICSLDC